MKKIIKSTTILALICMGQAFAISVGDVTLTTESLRTRYGVVTVKK